MGFIPRAVVLLCIGLAATARADATPPKLADAIKAASAAHQALIVEFGATWCGPCKELEVHVLPDPRAQAAIKDVMFVRYDAEAEPGSEAARKFNIDSFPTFIAIDKTGAERFRRGGMPPGEAGVAYFVALVGDARIAVEDEADVVAALKAKPNDAATALGAARWYAAHDKLPQALAQYDAIAASKTADRELRGEATRAAPRLRRVDQWKQQLVAEKLDLVRKDPAGALPDDLTIAALGSPPATARPVVAAALAAQTDPDVLNSLVYIALAANDVDDALAAAKRMTAQRHDPEHLDTLAECHHMRGDRAKALEVEAEAMTLAKGTSSIGPVLLKNQARFASGMQDSDDVIALRARMTDLWRRLAAVDQLADRVAIPSSPQAPASSVKGLLGARKASHDLSLAITKACAATRGKSTLADIRVDLSDTGAITQSTILLEDAAPAALRACIAKQLATAKLPAPPAEMRRQLLQLDFASP